MLAHGKLGKDAALIWFLHTPWRWCFWRWPRVERMGQFGRYTYRWRIGPLDGKWRPAYPQQLRAYNTWCSYRLEAAAWRYAVTIDWWYQPHYRFTVRVRRQCRIELL